MASEAEGQGGRPRWSSRLRRQLKGTIVGFQSKKVKGGGTGLSLGKDHEENSQNVGMVRFYFVLYLFCLLLRGGLERVDQNNESEVKVSRPLARRVHQN